MSISPRERWHIFQRDAFTCQYCGRSIITHTDLVLEVDHIKPLSKGGTDNPNNLATSCSVCNRGKHADRPTLPMKIENKPKPLEIKTISTGINLGNNFKDFCEKNSLTKAEAIEVLENEYDKLTFEQKRNSMVEMGILEPKKYPRVVKYCSDNNLTVNEAYQKLRGEEHEIRSA